MASSDLVFSVTRGKPVLVSPAKPTPHEFKHLSDIDDQEGLRFQLPAIQFYRNNPSMRGRDPAGVIRDAIAKALVFYYPFAGRIREGPGRKLTVECTGEGVVFIEADADVSLKQFGDELHPPFPCMEKLLYDVPGMGEIINCPLLLIQVTRLTCGGFIIAARVNHTMSDGTGLVQFLSAMAELTRGARAPSVLPVWRRELLSARDPPRVTHVHHRQYDQVTDPKGDITPLDDMAYRSFVFGPREISVLRKQLPHHLRTCSSFDLLSGCFWRCRTIAVQPAPDEKMRYIFFFNVRDKCQPPLPAGYYGNGIVLAAAISPASKLCQNPLGYAVELVKKAKSDVTQEFIQSQADLMVIKGRPHFTVPGTYVVSNVTRLALMDVDFGWGNSVYSGPARGIVYDNIPHISSFHIGFRNAQGEDRTMVSICLPQLAMERFVAEFESMMKEPIVGSSDKFTTSAL